MSHIHIPDGIIPFSWWIVGYAITFIIMFYILKDIKNDDVRRKIPITGIVAAIMLLGMSIPLGIIPVHLSLAALAGILVGPGLGFISVFVVNTILALFGHGGITIVGLNTLVIGAEVFIAYHIFKLLTGKTKLFLRAFISTSTAVITSLIMMILIVGFSVDFNEAIPHHHSDCSECHSSIDNTHHHEGENHVAAHNNHLEDEHHHGEDGHHHEEGHNNISDTQYLFFSGWAALAAIFVIAIILESLGIALVVNFFAKIRPDFIINI
ncbi:energy-coupling factor ABC transporter permease [Alkaliphilus pronyensis]|uniref:Energy-coupling factor ABC transporter permease n=1 Tax=Alkaliphilus pronyensis TaxID=1482732 RepID=A0A6I0F755_9FIRM|nr:energy-coupling factor ABC transporter permease [Alkaliphilus pronyensis]KAB3534026.1 energy-coupling factor ABC transporter permease [Alkaliphilus pronyensis]